MSPRKAVTKAIATRFRRGAKLEKVRSWMGCVRSRAGHRDHVPKAPDRALTPHEPRVRRSTASR